MAPSADPIPVTPAFANFPPPTHPDCLRVERSTKAFASGAYSLVDLPAGALFAKITTATPGKKAYTSVQTGRDTHIELNSDLSLLQPLMRAIIGFRHGPHGGARRGRPSFEGRRCPHLLLPQHRVGHGPGIPVYLRGRDGICRGWISGAKNMSDKLNGYWLNDHISELLNEKTN
ncbi:hypothetical protein N7519_008135 [Penicillium mononematosum]|uniref:uncharacterized protein n=1 Tax=Penicillium mononematosum TaxID=268346 RepID=UPI002547409E|nr:uncharacterized protein N7519_008135 [Penicillium mononematosum]KAJ6177674.1 hypothetical protein N7519_008135 [Penicillium mononematosum]